MKRFFPLGVLVLAGVLLSINISKPFIGQHDWNGVVYGQQAKNFVRFGYLPLKSGATLATFDTSPEKRKFSTHYTPVLPILISFSYRLLGVSEWSTRLVPVTASLASVFLVMLLGKELISFRAGIIAGILAAVTPMFIYYGKNPVHEVILLPFALLSFYSYWQWRQSWQSKWWVILLISLAAAMLIGWPGYYAAGLVAVHGFLAGGRFRARFLVLPALMMGIFLVFLLHGFILTSGVNDELRRAALSRMAGGGFGMKEFMAKELRYSINLFTATLLVLSGIWIVRLPRFGTSGVPPFAMTFIDQTLLIIIGIFGISHVLLFREAGWYHEYLLFPFLPFLALSAAAAVERRSALVILAIVVLTAVERAGYAKALLMSEYARDDYEEALQFTREHKGQNVRIPEELDVYFVFYADRLEIP